MSGPAASSFGTLAGARVQRTCNHGSLAFPSLPSWRWAVTSASSRFASSRDPGLGRVLVDERGPHRGVTHPVHELTGRGSRLRHQVVTRVAQVVEVEALREPGRREGLGPADVGPPIAPARSGTPFPREDERVGARGHARQVLSQLVREDGRDRHDPHAVVPRRRRLEDPASLVEAAMDEDQAGVQGADIKTRVIDLIRSLDVGPDRAHKDAHEGPTRTQGCLDTRVRFPSFVPRITAPNGSLARDLTGLSAGRC